MTVYQTSGTVSLVRSLNLRPGEGIVHGPNYAVQQSIRRAVKRGALEVSSPFYAMPGRPGEVYAIVRHRKSIPPPPAWRKPVMIGAGVLSGAGVLGWLGWLAVRATTQAVTQAGPAIGVLLALGFVLLCAAKVQRRRGHEITGTFRATIK